MLTVLTHLLHMFEKKLKMFLGLLPPFFTIKIFCLGLLPHFRTACPVSCYTSYTLSNSQLLSGFMAAGLSEKVLKWTGIWMSALMLSPAQLLESKTADTKRRQMHHQLPSSFSATGTRARVARVRAEYPDQLDYSGFWQSSFTNNLRLRGYCSKTTSVLVYCHVGKFAACSPVYTALVMSMLWL